MVESSKTSSNLLAAESLKAEGNDLFRSKNYKQAIAKYSKIFLYVNGLISKSDGMSMYAQSNIISEAEEAQVRDLKHLAHSNMAAAYLSLKQYNKVIEKSSLALAIRETPKVLYRRALAYIETGDIDNARIDLEKARAMEPGDAAIGAAFQRLTVKTEEILKKEKKKYHGLFDRMNAGD